MKPTEHPSSQTLLDFVMDHLPDTQAHTVMDHLTECEQCLGNTDRFWEEYLPEAADIGYPALDLETAGRVEGSLWRRIHRSDLGGQAIRLGTQSLWLVFVALLRPLFGSRQSSKHRRSSR